MIDGAIKMQAGDYEAYILPKLGANPIALRYKGRDILRPLKNIGDVKENPFLWGSPILIPANRTEGARFSFGGEDYTLPLNEPALNNNLHGVMYSLIFEIEKATDTEVITYYKNRGAAFPFHFDIRVTAKLSENGFSRRFEITNAGEGDMPLTFCLHTTFVDYGEKITVPVCEVHRKNSCHIPTHYGPLEGYEKELPTGIRPTGRFVGGYFHSCGNVATVGDTVYTVKGKFDHWIIFNGEGVKGLICIEPQAGRSNGLNDGGYITLGRGKTEIFETEIKVADKE